MYQASTHADSGITPGPGPFQRALDAIYRIGLVCHGTSDPRELLQAIYRELATVFSFDACLLVLVNDDTPASHQLTLLADEGVVEFVEGAGLGSLTTRILDTHSPLLFNDLSTEGQQRHIATPDQFGSPKRSRGWMGVPLLLDERALGVIALQSYTVGAFAAADLEVLRRIANSIAVVMQNAALLHRQAELSASLSQQVRLRTADLTVISDVAAMLIEQRPLTETMAHALSFILDLLKLPSGAVCEYDDTMLHSIVQHNLSSTCEGQVIADTMLELTLRHHQPYIVTEHSANADIPALAAMQAALVVPLRRGDDLIGLVMVGTPQIRQFRPEEVELMQVIGNQLALALEQAGMLRQRDRQIRELEALSQISRAAIRSSDGTTMLRQVHEAIQSFINFDVFYMAIHDPETSVLTDAIILRRGEEPTVLPPNQVPAAESYTGWMLQHRQTLFFTHASQQIQQYPALQRYTIGRPSESWIGVPLLDSDEQPLGLISIQSYAPYAFTPHDAQFLATIASQVSLHVRSMQLFKQRERQLAELNALQRISELINSTLNMDPMIHAIDAVLTEFFRADVSFVVFYDSARQTIEQLYLFERGTLRDFDHLIGEWVDPRTATGWVLQHLQPFRSGDVVADSAANPQLKVINLLQPQTYSWLGVPLITREGEVLGVVSVQSYERNRFGPRDEVFMLQVARQLSLTVQNIRLFAEREQQLVERDALNQIMALGSSTLELRPMLRLVDRVVRTFLHADVFLVLIYDNERDQIETAVIIEDDEETPTALIGQPPPQGSFVAWTLHHARPLRVANVYTDWQYYEGINKPVLNETRRKPALLSVPLLEVDTQPIGMLAVRSTREGAFSARAEQFLVNVGQQLTLHIRNARLYAAEQAARRTADTLREVARVLNTTFNPDEVLSLILEELGNVVRYDSASVMLPTNTLLRIVAYKSGRHNYPGWRSLSFPIDEQSGAGRVMLRGIPLIIKDTRRDVGWNETLTTSSVRSWIGVPLISKGTVLGVLNINSLDANSFTMSDAENALTFANQAATALEHARLYQESVTRVEQELEIARRIQANLFPQTLPHLKGLTLDAVCAPANETGGDFYDVLELNPNSYALMIGDASGKSIPGAILMAVARSIARSEAREHGSPQRVLRDTNRWLVHDVPPKSFVALAYATLDVERRRLRLANAGQLDPLRLRADGRIEYLTVNGPHLPLGIQPDVNYNSRTFQLEAGDLVLFYTDGVVEARAANGELWGFDRLEQTLRDVGQLLAPSALIYHIIWSISSFIGDHPQHDDITLVALRVDH